MTFETLLYQVDGAALTITMNRPERLNAMNDTMRRELIAAFSQAADDETVRVVVLTGAGRGFCSGADLAAAMENGAPVNFGELLRETYNPLVMLMRGLPKPIIAAVNGAAAGAGMSLALACDLRIAAESASFMQAFVKIGLVPDSGSTWLLPRLVGLTRALDLMLTGRRVAADEALSLGLVNAVVPDGRLMETVHETARAFAEAPTRAIGYIKQAVNFALDQNLEAALEKEAELQDLAGATDDHREGVAAFLEKRPPQFTGR
ncbi:MAG: enoyl-CoA hydratase/isomerase family protein [Chloroflexi bacterium]|nr:enoyl-CoA hydratase/isomerase family protein [Chloroflexota bacterium]